jgi:flagellar biosynthesis anti-sigma factor FlgM
MEGDPKMSIDRVNISNRGIEQAQKTPGTEAVRNTEKDRKVSSGSDSVSLSSKAKEMERLANTVEDSRADRLNQVREALENGTYRVSSRALAEKLIDSNLKK